jgi:hypothetical protein
VFLVFSVVFLVFLVMPFLLVSFLVFSTVALLRVMLFLVVTPFMRGVLSFAPFLVFVFLVHSGTRSRLLSQGALRFA